MIDQLQVFFNKNHFVRFTTENLASLIYNDMVLGLNNKVDANDNKLEENAAFQPMIPVYGFLEERKQTNQNILVIDAGGTNFRSCLVSFDAKGNASISELKKSKMPGIEKELSKEEFYNSIADRIDYLKNKADKIGFCFSYAMEMNKQSDGKVMVFSKEIKAPEVIGTYVGKELMDVLKQRGWTTLKRIVLLNDTVAALLSGFYNPSATAKYSSYIGFVFGTGINNAYIEKNAIPKLQEDDSLSSSSKPQKHIVVCECGMFDNPILSSEFDIKLDKMSTDPGASILEKMCSGAYMGKLAWIIIKEACNEYLFSADFAKAFSKIKTLESVDLDIFLNDPDNPKELLSGLTHGNDSDKQLLKEIITRIIERSSSIVAAVLIATIRRCNSGKTHSNPVCIVCNGSTFWKCHNLKDNVENILNENKMHFQIVQIDNDITIGSAIAAIRA